MLTASSQPWLSAHALIIGLYVRTSGLRPAAFKLLRKSSRSAPRKRLRFDAGGGTSKLHTGIRIFTDPNHCTYISGGGRIPFPFWLSAGWLKWPILQQSQSCLRLAPVFSLPIHPKWFAPTLKTNREFLMKQLKLVDTESHNHGSAFTLNQFSIQALWVNREDKQLKVTSSGESLKWWPRAVMVWHGELCGYCYEVIPFKLVSKLRNFITFQMARSGGPPVHSNYLWYAVRAETIHSSTTTPEHLCCQCTLNKRISEA